MTLISGLDYLVEGIDYNERHGRLLRDTFDTNVRLEYEPLWHLIDVNFDDAARDTDSLLGDIETIFCCVEDFCIEKNITNIPPLYANIFEARKGFLTQCKMPGYMSKAWLTRFPYPIVARNYFDNDIINEFKSFLEKNKNDKLHNVYALYELRRFMGEQYTDSDDEMS